MPRLVGRCQRAREPGEKRVSRRVAVGVVVGLEAVQVEQHEGRAARDPSIARGRSGRRRLPSPVRASVTPPPARHEQMNPLPESEHGSARSPSRLPRRPAGARRVEPVEVVLDEDREADRGEHGRHREGLPALLADLAEPAPGLPGRARDQHRRIGQPVSSRVPSGSVPGDLVQVDAVGDREGQESRAIRPQVRSTFQPESATTQISIASSRRSKSG